MRASRAPGYKPAANAAGPPLAPLPAATGISSAMSRWALPAILAIYLCIAGIHAARTPTGATGYQDAPDEEAHVMYARVVSSGRLPTRARPGPRPADAPVAYEWHQPPLYYLLAAPFLRFGERGARAFSVAVGVGCIVLIYFAAGVLFPERPQIRGLAAAIAALTPGHCAVTSVVSNDGLLELWFSAFLLLVFQALTDGLTRRRSIMIGAVLGAALLTKLTAFLLLPVGLLALVLLSRNGESRATVLRSAAAAAAVALVVSGWWFARNAALYHEIVPLTAFRQSFAGTVQASDVMAGRAGLHADGWVGYAALVARWTFQSFFAVYSTARGAAWGVPSFLPDQLYLLAGIAALASLIGLCLLFGRRRTELTRPQRYGLLVAAAAFGVVALSFALFTARYFQAQGRYFYPAMLPISLLGARGWRAVFPPRYAMAAGLFLVGYLLLFCIAFVRVVM